MNNFSKIESKNENRDLARVDHREIFLDDIRRDIEADFDRPFQLTEADLAPNPFHHASDEPDEPCDCFTCFGSGKTKGTLIDCPDCDGSGLVI